MRKASDYIPGLGKEFKIGAGDVDLKNLSEQLEIDPTPTVEVYGYTTHEDQELTTPKFKKLQGPPIFSASQTSFPSIYWPCVLKVDFIKTAKAKYYMWYSTNHDGNEGGIGLATSDDPKGPWKNYGKVYVDKVVGNSTETPCVIWNEDVNLFYMYYQNNQLGENQSTALATSPDGITWTRYGLVLDRATGYPGDGHTGYFKVFRFGGKWVGFSLMGGGNYGRKAISYSNDGKFWYMDPRPLLGGNDATGNASTNISRSNAGIFSYRGKLWWIGMVSGYASGGATTTAIPALALINPDLRSLAHKPKPIITIPTLPWETLNMQSMSVFIEGSTIYVYYNTDGNVGLAYSELSEVIK